MILDHRGISMGQHLSLSLSWGEEFYQIILLLVEGLSSPPRAFLRGALHRAPCFVELTRRARSRTDSLAPDRVHFE